MHVKAEFNCVYMLNGIFSEKASPLRYRINEPLYLTVLPLGAHHLPYTVKILNGKALTNEQLCKSYLLPDGKPLIKLLPRYNYVYSAKNEPRLTERSGAEVFFSAVKSGSLTSARAALTEELNATIDNDSLLAFFNDYTDIIESQSGGGYYLTDRKGQATLFKFIMRGDLIDDIVQE